MPYCCPSSPVCSAFHNACRAHIESTQAKGVSEQAGQCTATCTARACTSATGEERGGQHARASSLAAMTQRQDRHSTAPRKHLQPASSLEKLRAALASMCADQRTSINPRANAHTRTHMHELPCVCVHG